MGRTYVVVAALVAATVSLAGTGGLVGLYVTADALWIANSPVAVAVGFAAGIFVLRYRQAPTRPAGARAGVLRRTASFLVDASVLGAVFAPLVSLPNIAFEYARTGTFAWVIERSNPDPVHYALAIPMLLGAALLAGGYFYRSLRNGRPTLGQYALGLQVVPVDSTDSAALEAGAAFKRLVVSCLVLGIAPVSLVTVLVSDDSVYWWDTWTGVEVRRIDVVET